MASEKIFVGRKNELKQFKEVIKDPRGQAILVAGQAGMGKTWLINKMSDIAKNHPELKCGCVTYEVTPTDSVESTMALIIDNAYEASQVTEGSFNATKRRLEQWKGLLNIINIGDLVMSLQRDTAKNTREQFLDRMRLISKRLTKNSRAIFIIDPEKYMQENSDQSWAIVVKNLPEKIKFIFAQRPEDVLINSEAFNCLNNIVYIPKGNLDELKEEEVDILLTQRGKDLKHKVTEVRKVLEHYKGHPYVLGAALDLLAAGIKLEELPKRSETTKFAEIQWKKICDLGDDAMQLFEAYAILEVNVPDKVVEAVSGLNPTTLKRLQKNTYLFGLLRKGGYGKRIYHAILADYILEQIDKGEKKKYHERAINVYRKRLNAEAKPDTLAAVRLPEHVLAAQGERAFVDVFLEECKEPLRTLGLLGAIVDLSSRAMMFVNKDIGKVQILNVLALIYQMRGEQGKAIQVGKKVVEIIEKLALETHKFKLPGERREVYIKELTNDESEVMAKRSLKVYKKLRNETGIAIQYSILGEIYMCKGYIFRAEKMHQKALEIAERFGFEEMKAARYSHLGLIYQARGELVKGEKMHRESLEIHERMGYQSAIANDCKNLGFVYKEKGNVEKARAFWEKSLSLFNKISMPHEAEKTQNLINGLKNNSADS